MLDRAPHIPHASPLLGRAVRIVQHHRRVGGQVGTVRDLFWKGDEPWLVIQLTSGRRVAVAYGWTDLPPECCPTQIMRSDPDQDSGDPALQAARHGHLLARHADVLAEALPTYAAPDLALPQVWGCLPDDTKQAFGSRFSQIVVRVLQGLRTSEGSV